MPVHTRDQKLWLELREVRDVLLSAHEVRRALHVPSSLGLVKQHDVFRWRARRISQVLVAKVVHILDESLYLASRVPEPNPCSPRALSLNLVSSQRFPKNTDQGTISGKEHAVEIARGITVLCCCVQPNQRLPGPGHPRDKANGLLALLSRVFDQLVDRAGCPRQICSTSIASGDLGYSMTTVQRPRSVNDGWSGQVTPT
jgi:hypothetical protein